MHRPRSLARRLKRHAMPISRYVLSVALLGFSLGLTVVYALDRSPKPRQSRSSGQRSRAGSAIRQRLS
jgi:hypothetical protein